VISVATLCSAAVGCVVAPIRRTHLRPITGPVVQDAHYARRPAGVRRCVREVDSRAGSVFSQSSQSMVRLSPRSSTERIKGFPHRPQLTRSKSSPSCMVMPQAGGKKAAGPDSPVVLLASVLRRASSVRCGVPLSGRGLLGLVLGGAPPVPPTVETAFGLLSALGSSLEEPATRLSVGVWRVW
jgi:hypothetical protein